MTSPEYIVSPDASSLAERAFSEIQAAGQRASDEGRPFRLAIPGGNSPRAIFDRMAADPHALPWTNTDLFWVDERAVPPDHPDSNYAGARSTLLNHVPIPPDRVHRVRGELGAERAAAQLASDLSALTPNVSPQLDAVLLGLGEDGHVASLFPERSELDEHEQLAVAVHDAPKPPPDRVTMTLPTLNGAHVVLILAMGRGKADAVARCRAHGDLPGALVRPAGRCVWLLDEAAAQL